MSNAIQIEIEVSDAQITEEIAKLDALDSKSGQISGNIAPNQPGNYGPLYDEVSTMSPVKGSDANSDGDEAYTAMRETQRNDMFPTEEAGSYEGSFREGRLASAGLGILQGRMPTQTLLRSGLGLAGITGLEAMVAVFAVEMVAQEITRLIAEGKYQAELAKYESSRKAQYATAYSGVFTA